MVNNAFLIFLIPVARLLQENSIRHRHGKSPAQTSGCIRGLNYPRACGELVPKNVLNQIIQREGYLLFNKDKD